MRKINIIIVSFLLAMTMTLSMTACSNPAVEPTPTPTTSPSAQTNRTIDKAGQYEIDATTKTLEITAGGVVVKGGNLSKITVTESVGEGEVNFKNVKAETLLVKGGGQNSIYFEDSSAFETVIVEKKDTPIRLVNEIGSSVKTIEISTGSSYVIIEGAVNVLNVLTESVKIETKNASFESVKIDAPNVVIENLKNTNITTTEKATNASVNDKKVEADSSAKIYDSGAVIPPIDFQEPTTPTKPTVSVWKGEVDTAWFDATKTDFTIKNANQFAGIAKLVNDGITTFAGKTITLDIDIDLNSKEWTPIGNSYRNVVSPKHFAGTFDGKNHTISNLTHTNSTDTIDYLFGLFGFVRNATIKNIKLDKVNIVGNAKADTVSALVAYTDQAITIQNCHLKSGKVLGMSSVAGIISRIYSPGYTAVIDNCSNSAEIIGGLINGKLAGIVGIASNAKNVTSESLTISNCINDGDIALDVSLTDIGTTASSGILGYCGFFSNVEIDNCINNGDVSGYYSGGIIGYDSTYVKITNINDCENHGKIDAKNTAGGIVGISLQSVEINILKSVNTGEIGSYSCPTSGGIMGSSGNICSIVSCNNSGDIYAIDVASAIVGYVQEAVIDSCVVDESIKMNTTNENFTQNSATLDVGIVRTVAVGLCGMQDVKIKNMKDFGEFKLLANVYTNGGNTLTLENVTIKNDIRIVSNASTAGIFEINIIDKSNIAKINWERNMSFSLKGDGTGKIGEIIGVNGSYITVPQDSLGVELTNKNFYPYGSEIAGNPVAGKKYVYTVDCDTGVAGNQTGWKAQA